MGRFSEEKIWVIHRHVRVLITLFMTVAGQWKKVAYYFRSKLHLKPVMVILHATYFVLKIQWPI